MTDDTIVTYFKNAKKFAPSVYQYYNQYKLVHRRTVNNRLLKRIIIVDTEFCLFCNELIETIEHIYLYCDNVNHLWNGTSMWVRNI